MQGMVPAAGASPRSTGRNVWGHPVVFGAYRRRDTQVPPYEPCRQSVGECRAAPVCAAVRCGGDDDRRIPANPYPMYQTPGGAEGPKALSPQQCEAWIEGAAALFQNHRTKTTIKQLKIPTVKSFTRFFSCEGCPPPVCLRCSPGLFRHGGGAASCHTSSMAAKPHLGLTQNSSPTTLANERRAAQNRGVQRQSLWSPAAAGEIPVGRSQRSTRAAHGAKSHHTTTGALQPRQRALVLLRRHRQHSGGFPPGRRGRRPFPRKRQ